MNVYKKTLNFITIVSLVILIFTGCDSEQSKTNGHITSEVEFSYNLVDFDKTIEYNGSPISLTFELYNKADDAEFGIMIFIGGTIQKFKTLEYSKNEYMHTYSLKQNNKKSIDIELLPQNVDAGKYDLYVIAILNPSFTAEAPNYIFGYNHKITYASTKINITMDLPSNVYTYTDSKSSQITQEEIDSYKNSDGSNQLDKFMDCIIVNNGAKEDRKIMLGDGNLNIDFKLLGGDAASYYLTIFINHKPIKINNKYNNALINLEKEKSSTVSFNYDFKDIADNSVIYAIAIPADMSTDTVYPIKSDSIMIIK